MVRPWSVAVVPERSSGSEQERACSVDRRSRGVRTISSKARIEQAKQQAQVLSRPAFTGQGLQLGAHDLLQLGAVAFLQQGREVGIQLGKDQRRRLQDAALHEPLGDRLDHGLDQPQHQEANGQINQPVHRIPLGGDRWTAALQATTKGMRCPCFLLPADRGRLGRQGGDGQGQQGLERAGLRLVLAQLGLFLPRDLVS